MALMLQHSNRIRKLFSGSSCSSNVLETARTYYQNSLACCHVRAARGGSNLQSKKHFSLSVLSTLPEYKAAVDHDRLGNFPQAFPLYQRAHEVKKRDFCESVMKFNFCDSPQHHLILIFAFGYFLIRCSQAQQEWGQICPSM